MAIKSSAEELKRAAKSFGTDRYAGMTSPSRTTSTASTKEEREKEREAERLKNLSGRLSSTQTDPSKIQLNYDYINDFRQRLSSAYDEYQKTFGNQQYNTQETFNNFLKKYQNQFSDDSYLKYTRALRELQQAGAISNSDHNDILNSTLYMPNLAKSVQGQQGYMANFKNEEEYNKSGRYALKYSGMSDRDLKQSAENIYNAYKKGTADQKKELQAEYDWLFNYATGEAGEYIRKARTDDNDARLKAINEELERYYQISRAGTNYLSNEELEHYKELEREKQTLETENNKYRRGEHYIEDKYGHYAQNSDFAATSKQRKFDTSVVNEHEIAARLNPDNWRTSFDGKTYDQYGNEITQEYLDEWRRKGTVQDKLGVYLGASDEDIANAQMTSNNTNGSYDNILNEGRSRYWDLLTESEKDMYYYLLNKEGQQVAYEYLDDMDLDLGRRNVEKQVEEYKSLSTAGKILYNIGTVPASILGGIIGGIDDKIRQIKGEELNPYSIAHSTSNFASSIRGQTAEDISNWLTDKDGKPITVLGIINLGDVYQSVMSAIDSAVGAAFFGDVGGAVTSYSTAASYGYGLAMGMGAMESEARELFEAGASSSEIFTGSLLAGIAEEVFETVSLDKILHLKDVDSIRDYIYNFFTSSFIEGSEELLTEVSNILTDMAVRGVESGAMQYYYSYRDQGVSQGTASIYALKDCLIDVTKAFAGGFISGGLGSGGRGLVQLSSYNRQFNQQARQAVKDKNVQGIFDTAKKAGIEYSSAEQRVKDYLENNRGRAGAISATANVLKQTDQARIKKNVTDIQQRLQDQGVSERRAKKIAQTLADIVERKRTDQDRFSYNQQVVDIGIEQYINEEDEKVLKKDKDLAVKVLQEAWSGSISDRIHEYNIRQSGDVELANYYENARMAEGTPKLTFDGTVNGQNTSFTFDHIDGETLYVKTPDGQVVNADDVQTTNRNAIQVMQDSVLFGDDGARAYLNGYEGGSASEYRQTFTNIYNQAKAGANVETLVSEMVAQGVSEKVARLAAYEGQNAYEAIQSNDVEQIRKYLDRTEAKKIEENVKQAAKGQETEIERENKEAEKKDLTDVREKYKKTFEDEHVHIKDVDWSKLDNKKQESIAGITMFIRALGRDVVIEGSIDYKNGDVIYRNAANAYFDPADNSYHFNVSMMDNAYFNVAIHESIHDLAKNNYAAYKQIRDKLIELCDNDTSGMMDDFAHELDRLMKADTKGDVLDVAYEEWVANTVSGILADPNTFSQFANRFMDEETRSTFLQLIDAIMDYIREAFDKIKTALGWRQTQILENDLNALQGIREMLFQGYEGLKDRLYSVKDFDDYDGLFKANETTLSEEELHKYNLYVQNALNGKNNNESPYVSIGKVDNRIREGLLRFGEELSDDAHHQLQDNDVRHLRRSHGIERDGAYGITDGDIYAIPYILANYDEAYYRTTKSGLKGVLYVLHDVDTTYYVEGLAIDGNLEGRQMIKAPLGEIPSQYKNDVKKEKALIALPNVQDHIGSSPQSYVQDVTRDHASINNIDAQSEDVKSSVNTDVLENRAAEEFGTTYDWNETGYILTDGRRLDLSEKNNGGPRGQRSADHRIVGTLYEDLQGTAALVDFMNRGNIRITPETGGIDISVAPNKKQLDVLDSYISKNRGEVIVDISDEQGNNLYSWEYAKGTYSKKIINDITNFFKDGTQPKISDIARFRYSSNADVLDQQYEQAVSSGDMEAAQRMVDEAAERAGYIPSNMFHGSMNATFHVFDKSKANPEGNSGAGFYFTTNREDAEQNYADVEGADNFFKTSALADKIFEDGEWNGIEVEDYDHAKQLAKDLLNKEPGMYEVYLKYDNPYYRDYRNSTDILAKIMDDFDESLVDRDDYDTDEDYEEDLLYARDEHIGEAVDRAVYRAYSDIENQYEVIDGPFAQDVVSAIMEEIYNDDSLTWNDIKKAIEGLNTELTVTRADSIDTEFASAEFTRAIIENFGYDAIYDKEVSTKFNQLNRNGREADHIIVFHPNQIKLSDPVTYDDQGNVIPLSKRFNTNKDDIRFSSNTDSLGNQLTEQQDEYFKDSKIRDENGNLKVLYHGTNAEFNIFDQVNFGEAGDTAEGFGIYLTDTKEVAQSYGGRIIEAYANVTRPASKDKKTIKRAELVKLIKATCENEAQAMLQEGYDSVEDALKDTWISNYTYTYDKPITAAYNQVAADILRMNSNDMDIVQEVMVGMAIRDYAKAYDFYTVLTDTIGVDGFETIWEDSRDPNNPAHIVLAFNSEQVKNTDNKTPTSSPDIRYSSNTEELDSEYMQAVNAKDMVTAQRMVDEAAKRAMPDSRLIQDGIFHKMWHHTNYAFTSFLPGTSKSSGGLKGIYFTPQEYSSMSNLGVKHGQYYLNVRNPKFAFGISADRKYVDRLREMQDGIKDRNEIARINRQFMEETGVDAFFDWQNGWYNVMTPEQIKSADPVVYDDQGNIVPLSQRFNENNPDIRFSANTDTLGNELSEQQIEYFKDSQVRDEDGKLLVMYHGTDAYENFTVFKKGKSGYLGPGIYLSSSKAYADRYASKNGYDGRVYTSYVNITNPLIVTSDNPAIEILGERVARRREEKNSYATTWITNSDIKKLQAKGYDGIIWKYGNTVEVSAWEPKQIKNTGNKNPTENPDIRYSTDSDNDPYAEIDKITERLGELNEMLSEWKVFGMSEEEKARLLPYYEERAELQKRYEQLVDSMPMPGKRTEQSENKIPESDLSSLNNSDENNVENLKKTIGDQYRLTVGKEMTMPAAEKIARDVAKRVSSKADKAELANRLKALFDKAAKQGKDLDTDSFMDEGTKILRDVLEQSATFDSIRYKADEPIRKYLRETGIALNELQQGEAKYLFDSVANYRRALFGSVLLKNSGIPLDVAWQELNKMSSYLFPSDINDGDMVSYLYDAAKALSKANYYVNEYGFDLDGAAAYEFAQVVADYTDNKRIKTFVQQLRTYGKRYLENEMKEIRKTRREKMAIQSRLYEEQRKRNVSLKNEIANLNRELSGEAQNIERDITFLQSRLKYAEPGVDELSIREQIADLEQDKANLEARYREEIRNKTAQLQEGQEELEKIGKEYIKAGSTNTSLALDARKAAIGTKSAVKLRAQKEAQEIRTLQNNIRKKSSNLMSRLISGTDTKHVPENLREAVTGFLQAVDLGWNQGTLAAEKWLSDLNVLADKMTAANEVNGNFQVDSMIIDQLREMGARITERLSLAGKNLRTMSIAELNQLDDALSLVNAAIYNSDRLLADDRKQRASAVAERSITEMGKKKQRKHTKDLLGRVGNFFTLDQLDSFSYAERIGGPFKDVIFKNLRKAFDKKVQLVQQGIDAYHKAASVFGNNEKSILSKIRSMSGNNAQTKTFDLESGKKLTLNTAQIMELYLLNERDQARIHLYNGGITVEEYKAKDGTVKKQEFIKVTEDDIDRIIGTLTKEQKQFANELQKYASSNMSEWGNDVSLTLWGVKKFTEQNYWPITVDDNTTDAVSQDKKNGNVGLYHLKNIGMSKAVNPKANNALVIGDVIDTFIRHVDEMTSYAAYTIPLDDAMKWYNYKNGNQTVQRSIESLMGKGGKAWFTDFIRALNNAQDMTGGMDFADTMIRNAKVAAIAANLRVVIQQPSAFARAIEAIDPKYLLNVSNLNVKQGAKEAQEHSSIARWKNWGFRDVSVGGNLRSLMVGDDAILEQIREKASTLAGKFDDATWGALWNACKAEIEDKRKDLEKGSEEYWQAISDRFAEVIDRTQVVDSPFHRSKAMRSKNALWKMYTSFMSEPTKTYNMFYKTISNAYQGNWSAETRKAVARATFAFAAATVLNSVLAAIIDVGRDTDDEDWWQKYLKNMGQNMLDGFNPLNLIPIGKDIVSIFDGYEASRMDLDAVSDLIKQFKRAGATLSGEKDYNRLKILYDSVMALSKITGIPAGNAWREINSFLNLVGVDVSVFKGTWNNTNAKAVAEDMYSYFAKGDMAGFQRVFDKYVEDEVSMMVEEDTKTLEETGQHKYDGTESMQNKATKAVLNKLAQQLADNEEQIAEAYLAKTIGDGSEVARIRNEYIAKGIPEEVFDKAVNLYGSSMNVQPEGVNELNSKLYSYDDLYAAIESGDLEDIGYIYDEMKEDSQAVNPEKTIADNAVKKFKEQYFEYVASGQTTKANQLENTLEQAFGLTAEDLKDYQAGYLKYTFTQKVPEAENIELKAFPSFISKYNEFCKPANVPEKAYYNVYMFEKESHGEVDSKGKSIPYSKCVKVMAYIDSLNVTAAQKTALALCYYGKSTVDNYKLW